jgi:hypothetical protein
MRPELQTWFAKPGLVILCIEFMKYKYKETSAVEKESLPETALQDPSTAAMPLRFFEGRSGGTCSPCLHLPSVTCLGAGTLPAYDNIKLLS